MLASKATSEAPSEATFGEDKAAAKDPRNVARAKVTEGRPIRRSSFSTARSCSTDDQTSVDGTKSDSVSGNVEKMIVARTLPAGR